MSNNELPPDVQSRIRKDADAMFGSVPFLQITLAEKVGYLEGATTEALRAEELRKENERLRQLFEDLHYYCNQLGMYAAGIQDIFFKALQEGKEGEDAN